MRDPNPQSLPLIPIAPFLSTNPLSSASPRPTISTLNPSQIRCARALAEACLTHGFFYLVDHGIPVTLTRHVLALARDFFRDCTPEEKSAIRRRDVGVGSGDGARGYQVAGDNVTLGKRDWHEAVDWYRPIVPGEGLVAGREAKNDQLSGTNGTSMSIDSRRRPPFPLLHGLNLWPSYPAAFRTVYEIYVSHMLELGTAVVRAMGYALELDDPETFVRATRDTFWVMRAIGYPPLPPPSSRKAKEMRGGEENGERQNNERAEAEEEEEKNEEEEIVSCGTHTDYGCLTLLLADATPNALQVQARSPLPQPDLPASIPAPTSPIASTKPPATTNETENETWIPANPLPGAFVVNIGDMMERWTNGLWPSTRHRVLHRGPGMRVSVPFFFEPRWDTTVRPLRECVAKSGGVERFEEVMYGDHLVGKVSRNFYGG